MEFQSVLEQQVAQLIFYPQGNDGYEGGLHLRNVYNTVNFSHNPGDGYLFKDAAIWNIFNDPGFFIKVAKLSARFQNRFPYPGAFEAISRLDVPDCIISYDHFG